MEPTSLSHKVVSLHLQRCSGYCPNASVCYHRNKLDGCNSHILENNMREKLIRYGFKVHESLCEGTITYFRDLLDVYPNYNITLSCGMKSSEYYIKKEYKENIQITVYEKEDIEKLKIYQKLYLIKDKVTLDFAFERMKENTGRLHFLLDQTFVRDNKWVLPLVIKNFQDREDWSQSVDTCLTSWLVNGHCPYTKDYLDITEDGTGRKCPYARAGQPLIAVDSQTIEAYMNTEINHSKIDPLFKCVYQELFKGEINEQSLIDSSLQNPTSDNGSGGSIKRMRRFSLRD